MIHIVPFPESLRFVSLTNWEQLNCSTIMLSRSRSSHSNGVATWLQLHSKIFMVGCAVNMASGPYLY